MLDELGYSSMSKFINDVIPDSIAFKSDLKVGDGISEQETLRILKSYASKNTILKVILVMDIMEQLHLASSKEIFLKIRAGIRNTHLIKLKLLKVV